MTIYWQMLIAVISGGVLGEMIRHLLIRYVFAQEQQAQINAEIARKRVDAVEQIRLVCLELDKFELLEITHPDGEFPEVRNLYESPIYPSVLHTVDEWVSFTKEFTRIRSKYGNWVDSETGAWLLYIERYFMSLTHFIIERNLRNDTHIVGAMFFGDLQKWQREFDEVLVKRLNGASMKTESRNGKRWDIKKKKMKNKWVDTALYKVINNIDDEVVLMIKSELNIE